jgi:hypothetical protein
MSALKNRKDRFVSKKTGESLGVGALVLGFRSGEIPKNCRTPKKNMQMGIEDSGDNLLTREIGSIMKELCTENASVDAHAYFMVDR